MVILIYNPLTEHLRHSDGSRHLGRFSGATGVAGHHAELELLALRHLGECVLADEGWRGVALHPGHAARLLHLDQVAVHPGVALVVRRTPGQRHGGLGGVGDPRVLGTARRVCGEGGMVLRGW